MATPPLDAAFGQTGVGRPRTDVAIRTLVGQMAAANLLWGTPRIHDESGKGGIEDLGTYGLALVATTTAAATTIVAPFLTNRVRHIASAVDCRGAPGEERA
jgi:hypothetical protein